VSTAPRYGVLWSVAPDTDLYHAAKLATGLAELSRRGVLTVRTQAYDGPAPPPGERRAVRWNVVDNETRRSLRLALDLVDSAARIDSLSARECDVYFKRSFLRSEAERLAPPDARCVFLPLGLNHSCLSPAARSLYARAAWDRRRSLRLSAPGSWKAGGGFLKDLRTMAGLPPPEAFENFEPGGRTGQVLFQTRVWAPEPSTDDLPALNRERADLVRELKAAIPDAFVGGVMADAFSTANFSDVVTARSLHRAQYAAMTRRASIGVYSRGLHDSLAFKLSEYLASGLCVVSSPLKHELPEPLVAGRHYLPYQTAAECAQAVRWLLSHPDAARKMQSDNAEYYRTNLAPAACVSGALTRAFRTPG
jgi:hypothetical protein